MCGKIKLYTTKNKRGDARTASPHQPINKQGTIQYADSNHDLAITTMARVPPYTTPGKEQLLSYPRDSALLRFVRPEPTQCGICNRSAARNRHLYFTTRGLVGSFCERARVQLV